MRHRLFRIGTAALSAAVLAFGAAACGSSGGSATSASGSAISSQRCSENKAAGQITYLSGYQYQSSASILEYIAASKLGYFSDLCLNVRLQPGSGDTAQDTKLLASGQADIAAVAEQDLIQARANGIDIEGVSSYSDAGLDVLMTNSDITSLTQLDGKIVGDKGYVPAAVEAMLVKAGVNWKSLQVVKDNPTPGQPLGGIDAGNVTKIVDMLHQFSIIPTSVTSAKVASWFDDSYINADYHGDTLIWPAP